MQPIRENIELNENVEKNSLGSKQIKNIFANYGIVFALLLLIIVLSISNSYFLTFDNSINVLTQVSINAILAIGATYVILLAGIDLSVGSIVALSGVVAASFATNGHNGILLPIIMGLAVGLLVGWINGIVIAKWRVAPFIATLGMMATARGITYIYSDGKPISNLNEKFLGIGSKDILGVPIPVLFTVIVTIIFLIILYKTRFGRYVYAIGGSENAANVSGLKVNNIKIWVYSISGLLAGLAGILLSSRVSAGLPQAGMSYELDAIAAVVIGGTSLNGGKGRLWGSLVGALLIGVLNNGMDLIGVSSYWQQVVKGIIIVAAVMLDRKK